MNFHHKSRRKQNHCVLLGTRAKRQVSRQIGKNYKQKVSVYKISTCYFLLPTWLKIPSLIITRDLENLKSSMEISPL